MRKITVALLSAAYLCLALTAAVLLWRSGAGWGASLSGLIGVLGLAFALQNVVSRTFDRAQLSSEIEALRDANLLIVRQIEAIQGAIGNLGYNVGEDAMRRSEALTGEVRMLEALVQRMSESLDDRLANLQVNTHNTAAIPSLQHERRRRQQTVVLLEEVREALAANRVDLYLQPIVSLPQRRTVYYEGYSRLRDETGRVMMPAEYLPAAEPGAWSAPSTICCCSAACRSCAASPSRNARSPFSATSPSPPWPMRCSSHSSWISSRRTATPPAA